MLNRSPESLWQRFTTDIANPQGDCAPSQGESFDEVMDRVRELSILLPPRSLHVVDRAFLEQSIGALTEDQIVRAASELASETGEDISFARAREIASEQFAVLNPINLLSFPYPEIRSILIGRFGANSVVDGLRDLFDLESDEFVKGVIIESMHGRLHWKDVNARERWQSLAFAEEVLNRGYHEGTSVIAARAAFSLLSDLGQDRLPEAIQISPHEYSQPQIDRLSTDDRIGFIRILGPRFDAKPLLDLVSRESDPQALEELLHVCDARWGRGFMPLEDPNEGHRQREFWRSIGDVMIERLGLSELSPHSLRIALETAGGPEEPHWQRLLRKLALVALDEGS